MDTYRNGDLVFDVTDSGPADGPVVVLLHGFPQFRDSWDAIIPTLTDAGFRCLAPDQRGYSPGARPMRRRDYRTPLLVDDVRALLDSAGAERAHVVGHDWGAGVAWQFASTHPERTASLTSLSVPHPAAFLKAMGTSRQFLSSWYMFAFQLPALPERFVLGTGGQWQKLSKRLQDSGQTRDHADRDAQRMAQDRTFTAAVNWYRAMPLSKPADARRKTPVPTLFVWGDQDLFCKPKGAYETVKWVDAPYRFEPLAGASHWLPEERADVVSKMLLEQFEQYPA